MIITAEGIHSAIDFDFVMFTLRLVLATFKSLGL